MNCIDCLDRTNVVQACIAKHMLDIHVMSRLGIDVAPEASQEFEAVFKTVWANNGDWISQCYTVTGKGYNSQRVRRRSRATLRERAREIFQVSDQMLSSHYLGMLGWVFPHTRFYNNNLKDGFRQTAIDLALGNIELADTV